MADTKKKLWNNNNITQHSITIHCIHRLLHDNKPQEQKDMFTRETSIICICYRKENTQSQYNYAYKWVCERETKVSPSNNYFKKLLKGVVLVTLLCIIFHFNQMKQNKFNNKKIFFFFSFLTYRRTSFKLVTV